MSEVFSKEQLKHLPEHIQRARAEAFAAGIEVGAERHGSFIDRVDFEARRYRTEDGKEHRF